MSIKRMLRIYGFNSDDAYLIVELIAPPDLSDKTMPEVNAKSFKKQEEKGFLTAPYIFENNK